jgi:hypothetical protein
MKRYRTLAGAVAVAAALIASSLLAAAPSQADDPTTGTVVVHIVDQYGRATAGSLETFDADGNAGGGLGGPSTTAAATQTLSLPAGGYGFASLTPWAGVSCAGVSPCGITSFGDPQTVTPVVTVVDGATTTYTMHVVVPSISGGTAVGSRLTLNIPPGLAELSAVSPIPGGVGGYLTQQWRRGATAISGATSTSYTTTYQDGSQRMSAVLAPSQYFSLIFAEEFHVPVTAFTTNAITMQKFVKGSTKTQVKVAKRVGVNERASVKVKVTSPKGTPAGSVTLKIGKFRVRKSLANGAAFFGLPHLKAGKYKLVTSYSGSVLFNPSKAKKVKVTVHK